MAATLAVAGCTNGDTDASKATRTPRPVATTTTPTEKVDAAVTIDVSDQKFAPAETTIKTGQTVTWKFDDSVPHNVQGIGDKAMGINSPIIREGEWSYTFTTPGSYRYLCSLHPNMRGTITVE
ncbi:hypothetical protein GCM10023318_56750 [Nocardia callitridis]|uniref:Blue (type 1) copper domain-containing protein n=2 Tax=Nocardia callitridis TaxID=648753 RepID=A0ABP9KYH9_9NOCA